jgi:hypothetical protein
MEYLDILSTALYWYAIVGVAILIGSMVVYAVALLIYRLLAWLATLLGRVLGHIAEHAELSLKRHHPVR